MKLALVMLLITFSNTTSDRFEKDVIKTPEGELAITFIGHGTLMMEYNGKVIHIDPVGQYADYSKLPKADLVLITHHHGDHLDALAVEKIRKSATQVVLTTSCQSKIPGGTTMKNGDSGIFEGIEIKAVPAYNIKHERSPGIPFHQKGEGNGYLIRCDNMTVYVAGDTENIPEMKLLKNIDIAFLPMNIPYTMTPEMVADAARSFRPKILYPYHFGNTDLSSLPGLLTGEAIEIRIRNMK
jgi:L-ascorbate metabolism protein UlaG (beta-lactamase superfamily)